MDTPSIYSRPHLLLAPGAERSRRPLEDLRRTVAEDAVPRRLWNRIRADADAAIDAAPLTVYTPLPERTPADIEQGNAEYIIVHAAGQRVLQCALAGLLTGKRQFADAALTQIYCLFDREAWPEWQDLFHRRTLGFDADLRTGQLCRDLGLAYDWLYGLLDPDERQRILEGIDRCGVQPFLRAVSQDPPWTERLSNWTTCIVGGLGLCGMALGPDHPESEALVERAEAMMSAYLEFYGVDGEFNENPSYASSSVFPTLFYSALRCHRQDTGTTPELDILHRHCYWYVYATAPPGHVAAFGDGGPDAPAETSIFPAVAAATRDPVLQWFYLTYGQPARFPVWELLWLDATLEAVAPTADRLPLGRAYRAHSALVSSRTSWDPDSTPCLVFGKGGHGGVIHSHPDAGQVEIHGRGRRLIVDLGKVYYPPGDDRRPYYQFGTAGHNVVTVGGRPLYWEQSGDRRSHLIDSEFDDGRGGWWKIDLTELHEGVKSVERLVVHLFPGFVVVMDRLALEAPEEIRLRWHAISEPILGGDGCFSVSNEDVTLSGRVVAAVGPAPQFFLSRHEYRPPLDRDRMGNLLPQRREPYLDSVVHCDEACLLSLFAVEPADTPARDWLWVRDGTAWRHQIGRDETEIEVTPGELRVTGMVGSWKVLL